MRTCFLDVPNVSISPEHDSTKGNGLSDGEEEIQGDGSTKHVVEAAAGEQPFCRRVREVVARSGEGEPSHEEGKGSPRLSRVYQRN